MIENAVTLLKTRLRADLVAAMKAGARDEVALLRTLLGALDNAEAVAVAPVSAALVQHDFYSGSAEVARRVLDRADVVALLTREIAEREAAATQFTRLGKADHAQKLSREADLVRRYLAD